MLAQSGAERILKEYDNKGEVNMVCFSLTTQQGNTLFKLPVNVEAVMQVINNQTGEYKKTKYGQTRIIPQKFYNDYDQARRVSWRIIKDWLEAQLALYFLQMVKIEEIFLPYMYDEKKGKTMFQMLEDKNFNLQLE